MNTSITVDGWWADLPGPGFRVIGPSRFGYFGSTLPPGGTAAAQADAYAMLLEHLDVDCAVVIGFSAGSGSILGLALRHPRRVIGLILASCRLGGDITFPRAFAPLFRLAYSADRLFWMVKRLAPTAYARMMGMPKRYLPLPQEAAAVAAGLNMLFPLKPRREGAVFDGFVSNLAADRFPFEQIAVPTLFINARDDTFAPYRFRRPSGGPHPRSRARQHRNRRLLVPRTRHRTPRRDRRLRPRGDLSFPPPRLDSHGRLRRPLHERDTDDQREVYRENEQIPAVEVHVGGHSSPAGRPRANE